MDSQKNRYDPRFYFISVSGLTLFRQPQEEITLLFRLGTKSSESRYSPEEVVASEQGFALREEEALKEVHLLKYGAEEFLNVFVKTGSSHSYSRVLLPPLLQHPHTRHSLTVRLFENIFCAGGEGAVGTGEGEGAVGTGEGEGAVGASGEVRLELYFQFDFAGSLEVIPVSAHLERNIAQIGEMKPRVRLELEGERWCSLEAEGGIHPHWSGHFHANRASNRGLIDSIEENLRTNKLDQWARLLKMASNSLGISKKEDRARDSSAPYFDCTEFSMRSAGSYLKVEIVSDPFLGSSPDVIGQASIRVEDEGLLKYPRKPHEKLFEEKLVQLFHLDEATGERAPVGVLKLYVRFVFDKEAVIKKNRTYSLL